jgi:class 3 adenylate cyclase
VSEAQRVVADRGETLPPPIERVASIGAADSDSDEVRLRKRVLNLTPLFIIVLSPAWVGTYLVLGLWLPAAVPSLFAVVTALLLFVHSRRPIYRPFRTAELTMMLLLPFALQWSLGGFANSSAMALWALTAPMGAVFFIGARQATPWFGGFVALIIASALADPALSENAPQISEGVIITFFALNLGFVSATVFLLLQYFVRARDIEQERSERLLLNVLPELVARRLKHSDGVIADAYPEATVLFADIVNFTTLAERLGPEQLVELLDRVFTRWDLLAAEHGLEKIKTIGDEYMVVGGVPEPRPDHAAAVASMALEMLPALAEASPEVESPLRVRIGIDTGPVVAGVIGRSKFTYDLWGDTVNTASRMESSGEPGRIQITERMREQIGPEFKLEARGAIEVKGKGSMTTYMLEAS